MSKVSIIVPIYNSENNLEECINSLCDQTYKDIEIILINDGSVDDSEDICKRFVEKDERIIYYYKENNGVSSARNKGIELSSGEYICFVDSDDFVSQTYCEDMVKHMTNDVDMVVYGMKKYNTDTKDTYLIRNRLSSRKYSKKDLEKIIIDDGTLSGFTFHSTCSVLYKRKVMGTDVRFRKNVYYNEDGLFNVEYVYNCGKDIYVDFNNANYYYRTNYQSASNIVDFNSLKYVDSMKNIEEVLRQYINVDNRHIIEFQINKRKATLLLSYVLRLLKSNKNSNEEIRCFLSEKEVKTCFHDVSYKALTYKKKILLILIKLKCVRILKFITKIYGR